MQTWPKYCQPFKEELTESIRPITGFKISNEQTNENERISFLGYLEVSYKFDWVVWVGGPTTYFVTLNLS